MQTVSNGLTIGFTTYVLPYAGSIIGATAQISGSADGDTVDCTVTTSGTASFATTQLTFAAPTSSTTQAKDGGSDGFAAGETLKVSCSGANLTGDGTEDLMVTVVVEY